MKTRCNDKIGEFLVQNNLITEKVLNDAMSYQHEYDVCLAQYLVVSNMIEEEELAKTLCGKGRFPYISLEVYNISSEVINMVPNEIAEKYWLVPVDKIGNLIMVVMLDPFDTEAIKKIEDTTHCKVKPFVGILSHIRRAIKAYYRTTDIGGNIDVFLEKKIEDTPPTAIDDNLLKSLERRRAQRANVDVEVQFPLQEMYEKSKIKNLSSSGFLFESSTMLPIASYIVVQITLPEKYCHGPIAVVAQVVRVVPLNDNIFHIGVRILKIPSDDAEAITEYTNAFIHKE